MWGSVGQAARYLRTVNISKSIITNLKECGSVRHPTIPEKPTSDVLLRSKVLSFSPRSITEIQERNRATSITEFPLGRLPVINPRFIIPLVDNVGLVDLSLPAISEHEVQAARLIVIRRKKMKKHKLRKLRKKMRSRWHQIKQRRRLRKEKAFRAELLAIVKAGEEFSAEKYVADKIAQVNHTPLPRFWKGKRLPVFIIRQLMGIDKKINYKHTDVYKA